MEELNQTKGLLNTAINHTTDNPIVNTEAKNDRWYSNAEVLDEMRPANRRFTLTPALTFDNTQLALQMESLTKGSPVKSCTSLHGERLSWLTTTEPACRHTSLLKKTRAATDLPTSF